PEDDECSLFLKVKNNLAPRSLPGWKFRIKEHRINDAITAPYVKWIGKDERNIDAILTGNKKKESKKLDAAADFLLDTLRDGRTILLPCAWMQRLLVSTASMTYIDAVTWMAMARSGL